MPLTSKGRKIEHAMEREYGEKKGKQVFYASKNKGTISGVEGSKHKAMKHALDKKKHRAHGREEREIHEEERERHEKPETSKERKDMKRKVHEAER